MASYGIIKVAQGEGRLKVEYQLALTSEHEFHSSLLHLRARKDIRVTDSFWGYQIFDNAEHVMSSVEYWFGPEQE